MDKQQQKQLKVFGFGLPLILCVLAWRHAARHQGDVLALGLLAAAAVILFLTLFYRGGLEVIFKYWMKVAHMIGMVVTTLILTVLYYCVFFPVGLILRLAGKDYMCRRINKGAVTYWVKPETNIGGSKQQF